MNIQELTDFDKWSLFKGGDDHILSIIYTENSKKLFLYGVKFTSDNSLVEDSIHDLFTELIKNRRNLGDTDNILFYLLKAFKRKLIRKIQSMDVHMKNKSCEDLSFNITYSIEHDIILEELSKQKRALLASVLKNLSRRQKEATYLRFTKELKYQEIAEIMDISVEACRNLISGAVKILKETIRKEGGIPFFLFLMVEK